MNLIEQAKQQIDALLQSAYAAAADAGRYPRIAFSKYRLCRTHISPDLKEEDLLDV